MMIAMFLCRNHMIPRSDILNKTEGARPLAEQNATAVGDEAICIWLVDDNDRYRTLLAEILEGEADFDCARQFSSGKAVIEALARETPPEVILLDIDMGGMSGLEAIRPIKSLAGATHVLMLTAFFDCHRRTRALRAGATDFLLKSYSL